MTQPLAMPPKRNVSTAVVWIVSLASLGVAGLLATAFGLMAAALDPTDIVTAGIEPWTNAALAVALFAAVVVTTGLALVLWHRTRLRALGAALAVAQAAAVVWACVYVYGEYS